MRVILAGFALWFWVSAFLVFALGALLWLLRKFSPLSKIEGAAWARLTALGLILPPSSGLAFAICSLVSALSCPATASHKFHLCLHSARHFCLHSTSASLLGSNFVLWATLLWFGLTGAALALTVSRRRRIRFIEPSPKLRQAIAQGNLPGNLPVWETDSEIPAGVVGFLSPSIFVSSELVRRLPEQALVVVLRHEYAHLVRRDHWLRLLLFSVALIFTPTFFAIWLQKEWRNASEQAADHLAAIDRKSARLLSLALKSVQSAWVPLSLKELTKRSERLISFVADDNEVLTFAPATLLGLALCAAFICSPPLWSTFHCFAEALVLR